jgi:hypothetical protein
MRNLPIFSRRLIPLLIAVGALVALALEVVPAGATTATKPAIEPQSPAEDISLPASEEALSVSFTCPSFVFEEGEPIEEEEGGEEGEGEEKEEGGAAVGPPVLGGAENYGVHFSTSSGLDKKGQLTTSGFGEAGEGEAEAIKGTPSCKSELELPSTAGRPATLYEGRVYWQAYRESEVAPDGVEVGPVRSFVLYPHVEEPELTFREQIFAGYLTKVHFSYESELPGTAIALQELEGGVWKTIAEAPGNTAGENTFFFKPKKSGRFKFRPLVIWAGPQLGLESETKAVRKPTKTRVTSAADDGNYLAASMKEREEWPITLSVRNGGTVLRNLSAEAETTCKGPTKAQDVKLEVGAFLRNAKIAPDGTVFGVTKTSGPEEWTVTFTGSLFQGRLQGELTTAHANCTGYRMIDAVLSKSKKK